MRDVVSDMETVIPSHRSSKNGQDNSKTPAFLKKTEFERSGRVSM